jgi:flagellar biogenesis protein FliO
MGDALTFGSLLRLLLSFGAVVGALLLLRRWSQRGNGTSRSGMRVVARVGVARGASVAVVAVGRRHLVVGASEHGVRLLRELDDEDVAELDSNERPAEARGDRGSIEMGAGTSLARDGSARRPRIGLIGRLQQMTLRSAAGGSRGRPR